MSVDVLGNDLYATRTATYRRFDGGLNTRKAQHDLDRNELAALVNAWYAYGTALSKRPGSSVLVAALPDGGNTIGLVACRFNDLSYLIVQTSHNNVYAAQVNAAGWGAAIGTVTGGILRGAQMYDPKTAKDTVFLVTGKDTPQMWQGPGTNLVAVTTGANYLPANPSGGALKPSYVATLGNNSHLFYAGDSTAPNAVYVSDAFAPESFTTPAMQADPYGYDGSGTFLPAVIGLNDGIDGGSVTALQTLGSAMIVFKESAIYAMVQTQLLGNVAWRVYNVAAQRGNLSPRAVVAFESFCVFLAIDGLYFTYGQPNEPINQQKISANVPTFFDSSRFGTSALIANRTTAVAVRNANRYIIFFDSGTGNPDTGVWFDFDVLVPGPSGASVPAAGEITGMVVGGAVQLTGPSDAGNFAWGSATSASLGLFGVGFTDLGTAIAVSLAFKSDAFEDELGDAAMRQNKVISRVDLLVEPLSQGGATMLQFAPTFAMNHGQPIPGALALPPINTPAQGGSWGQNWGSFNWSQSAVVAAAFVVQPIRPQRAVAAYVIQFALAEASAFPWILVGFVVEFNAREVSR
ncbi:MAG: hypothetical protein KGL39_44845 [Patescibacteria group bacterium]|nr:hypothetical protein [Patescibacteria group bacterium]